MASSIVPSSTSVPGEPKWVNKVKDILIPQLHIDLDIPSVSVFQVPETLTTKKPEAYEPQQIGLGPLHHLRPGKYTKMQQKKLDVMRNVLKGYGIKDGVLGVVKRVRKHVPVVRSCYDMYLEDDDDSLAWIFAIDGLFLLKLFHTISTENDGKTEEYQEDSNDGENKTEEIQSEIEEIVKSEEELPWEMSETEEIMKSDTEAKTSEKQIGSEKLPNRWSVKIKNLLELFKFSRPPPPPPPLQDHISKTDPKRRLLAQDILMVENQIPLTVLDEIQAGLLESSTDSSNGFSTPILSIFRTFCEIHSPLRLCSKYLAPTKNVEHLLGYMYSSIVEEREIQLRCAAIIKAVNLAKNIPVDQFVEVYKQTILFLETFSRSKVLIPSASELRDRAEFTFGALPKFLDIHEIVLQEKYIRLPCITLNKDSEVILRNLVAYETLKANSNKYPITEYMSLMCALIVNVEDVKYLRSCKIIAGDLDVNEVTKLFTEMSSSIPPVKAKDKSKLQIMINDINKVYECKPTIKMYLFLQKIADGLLVVLKVIRGYVEASWKIVAFICSIVTVFMLTWQAYCDIYGCDKTTITLPLHSSA